MSQALWQEATRAELVEHIDRHCPKRRQGLTTGQYLAIAAINRAISPRSKRSMWDWFCQTVLRRHLPAASPAALNSQRFWDHMDAVKPEAATAIWKDLIKDVVQREGIDLSSICYDGTNFYTFLDTFNTRCSLAVRGKNKQVRDNLRQVSYALFCVADGQLPLFYEVYEGNRNDSRQFPLVLERFTSSSASWPVSGGRPRNDPDLRQGKQLRRQLSPDGLLETEIRELRQTERTPRVGPSPAL